MSDPIVQPKAEPSSEDLFRDSLQRLARRLFASAQGLDHVERLSGGASQETWSFDVLIGPERRPLILRRAPPGYRAPFRAAGIVTEALIMQRAGAAGVPSPNVVHILQAGDGLGQGFLMDRVAGETIPRKILRDPVFAELRSKLAYELGAILARIHAIDIAGLTNLRRVTAQSEIAELYQSYTNDHWPRPVFEWAFKWLEARMPEPAEPCLVHGDFRNGNLIVGPEGVRAVLDWELAHQGDPMEDLGWLCVNSWRFGVIDKPVGGFGQVEDLIAGYEATAKRRADLQRILFWQILGTLRWGVMCLGMLARYESGEDRSIERAMIARRASETEIDLLRLIAPRS